MKVGVTMIPLVDKHRLWYKSSQGLGKLNSMCRNHAFCSYAIKMQEPLILRDTLLNPEFADNPLVVNPPHIRFYAGVQLTTSDGFNIGTLCCADGQPKPTFGDDGEIDFLKQMAKIVLRELELNKKLLMSQQSATMQINATKFSQEAMGASGLNTVFELAVVTVAENIDVDYINIIEITPNEIDGYHVHSSFGFDEINRSFGKNHSLLSMVNAAALKGDTLIIDDIQDPDVCDFEQPSLMVSAGLRSVLCSVIKKDEKVKYMIACYKKEKYFWSEDEVGFLDSMAKSISGVVERQAYESQIAADNQKSDNLLLNILPKPIFQRLKLSETNIADGIASATILFADIVGFTELSSKVTPKELVGFLNLIFSSFDRIAQRLGCEKVKTIGDCYLCCAGLLSHEDDHAETILNFALEALDELQSDKFKTKHINMRIGINTGPVVAGVIGLDKFVYDIWGDAVNIASRMESHGAPGKIQISKKTYDSLVHQKAVNKFNIVERGLQKIKGKGEMRTYWVEKKQN
ncbi:adenylate cyclase [Acrasis kona]|uniref:Adenylate cyclase n=1 Tax=Acrasis kona TaxID=1008807 RepID=A0AAW2ZDQ5_9EUKA